MTRPSRRVLFLSYYFPPHGGAGVQRSVKFVKYLPDMGYEAIVVTGGAEAQLAWAPADPALDKELPAGTEIVRIEGPEPPPSGAWRGRAQRTMRLPSSFSRWLEAGLTRTGATVAERVDLIYASMSPWETGDAAQRLSRRFGIPWVADLRDPWALDDWAVYPTGLHRRLELSRMRRLLGSAAAIIMNTPGAAVALRRSAPELSGRVHVIPNGYDAVDFAGPRPVKNPGIFRVVFCGYAHASFGRTFRRSRRLRTLLGGAVRGLDPISRYHLFLVDAVGEVLVRRRHLVSALEVHLAGVGSVDGIGELACVVAHGYVPHTEAIDLVRSADLLFLPLHDLAPDVRGRTVPAKSYEYLASGRPILAAVPEGDTRNLLSGAACVTCCSPKDVGAIARALEDAVESWQRRGTPLVDRSALIAPYERRALTAKLARVFDDVA